jgi:hypothetical protein
MSKQARAVEAPCQSDLMVRCNNLKIQYDELVYLREEVVRLLRSKRLPSRKRGTTRRNWSARAVRRNDLPVSGAPILLLIPE